MNDEISKIINDLQRIADRKCYSEDILDGSIAQEWVDYITNLQEENKKVHKDFDELSERYFFTKSRNKKAIEYCDREIGNIIANFDYVDTKDLQNVKNILNGGDE